MSAPHEASVFAVAGTASAGRPVGAVRATVLCYRVLLRQIVSAGRLWALGALGAAMILVGWVVGNAAEDGTDGLVDPLLTGASYADGFGLILIVPIVSLVFAAAALGDARDDGTLVYLWLRPIGRAPLALGAACAAVTVALPLCVAPTVAGGWLATDFVAGSGAVALGALAAAALGAVAYSCVFVLLGLLFRKAVLWGIAYVLLWEGLAVGLGDFAERLSLRGYARAVLARIADVDLGFTTYGLVAAIFVLASVSALSLVLATVRLGRLDVD
ncbi:ABC transporter permease [Candidatus Poriferisodalis sp.]|uniref:ABC transporter permease n=1 Tax=Candidatus Poriferisodalis sp. TaxID=3101277 RepID=UPI003B018E86